MRSEPFFFVTGAGRSGTSAVARVLHESGVCMGREMAAASNVNPEGFYEDLDVVALNERILTDIGMNQAWRPERWPSRATVLDAGVPYQDDMAALVGAGSDGWKDPRFAITLEAWLPALPSPPKIIVCLRSPQAYADSATRIDGLVKPARAMREWARHYRRLLAVIRRYKLHATCIEYDALVDQPDTVVAALSRFVGRPLDASFVVPRLRREYAPVPEAHRALYERVAELGEAQRITERRPPRVKRQKVTRMTRAATPDYEHAVDALVSRVVAAKTQWEGVAAMPAFPIASSMLAACEAYNAVLIRAQREVAELVPPSDHEGSHGGLVHRINIERMIAEVSRAAVSSGDKRTRGAAIRAWRKYSSEGITR